MTTIAEMIMNTIREYFHTSVNNTYMENDIDAYVIGGHSDGDMTSVSRKVNEGLVDGVVVKLGYKYFVVSYNDVYVKCYWLNNQSYLVTGYTTMDELEEEENNEENDLSEAETDED